MPSRRPPRERRPSRRRRIRKLRLLALVGVLGVLSSSAFTLGLVSAVASEIPSLDPERRQSGHQTDGIIYAADGRSVLAVLRGSESRVLVEWDEIDPWLKHAIVAVEDRRFWEHRGIDLRGIARALWADIQSKALVEGGSTITQQFVKNAYVPKKRSLGRKVREAALAWQLEQDWSKQDILTAYLNTIYFGNGAYGVQQASKTYFGKGAAELTLAEAALLAGIPADPSGYDPITRPQAARGRRTKVLRDMLELGSIDARQFDVALHTPLPAPHSVRLPGTQGNKAPYFTNYVKEQLLERYGERRVYGGGLRVQTTIDLRLQELAREAISKWLGDPDGPAAALVAIDPTTGNVLAMVGGRNYRELQFNLAVQGDRQPGSAFKPIVLAAALEEGVSPSTTLESKPQQISLGDRVWSVENYEEAYLGSADLETATATSDNAVYAQLTQLVGPAKVAQTARMLGIRSPLRPYFSIGLGAQAVNPLELARAFSAFANGGYRMDTRSFGNRPRAVHLVRNERNEIVDENLQAPRKVLSRRTAALVSSMLQRVVEQGTGTRAAVPGWPLAGKTGTTENYGDAWFVGYAPQLVVAVWVGYSKGLVPMETEFRGEPVAGGTYPALIWKSFMERALPSLGKEPEPFAEPLLDYAAPSTVVRRDGKVQLDNGLCREPWTIHYFEGFGPEATADCKPNEVQVPRVVGQPLERAKERLALQPLTPKVIYERLPAGKRLNVVLRQLPPRGRLSSYDTVTLVLGKAAHGLVPNVEGTPLAAARRRLRDRKLAPRITRFTAGRPGEVVSQSPDAGVAAAPGMRIDLVVARG